MTSACAERALRKLTAEGRMGERGWPGMEGQGKAQEVSDWNPGLRSGGGGLA